MKKTMQPRFLALLKLLSALLVTASLIMNVTNAFAQSAADTWPQFRGLNGNASAPDADTPTHWSDEKNIAWKSELPGRGSSSPIVVGDKIFLTAYSGYGMLDKDPGDKAELRLHTICLSRENGKILWDSSIPASPNEQKFSKRVADHGYASGTPASDGESVFSFFGVSGVAAYDLDGNERWHNTKLGSKTTGFGSASSPVVFGDLLYINASIESGTLYALDKTNGSVVWENNKINRSWSAASIGAVTEHESNADGVTPGDHELVINQKETVFGLDPATGAQLWSCVGIQDYVVPVPIVHDGIAYCLGGRSNRAMAIRLGGRGDVTQTHQLWETNVGANVTSPVLVDGYLYWASDKGIANCMNAENGESVFRERMPTRSRVYASIVRGGDKLYLTTRDSGVQVLAAAPAFKQLALNKIESDECLFNASPAIHNDQILLRTDSYLYCIGEQ